MSTGTCPLRIRCVTFGGMDRHVINTHRHHHPTHTHLVTHPLHLCWHTMGWSGFEVSLRHSGHLGREPNWDQSFFDSGNETPDPSFLEHLQWMERARDAWLKARNEERLKRASRARNRPLAHFRSGDEVDFWRRGKGKGARPHIKGRFHGGAVVLATSTEIDEEDGSRKPRKVAWITHAGTLVKCKLRCSSERARQLANMGQAQRLPWTQEGLDGWLRKGQYEDLSMGGPPDEDKTDDEPEGLEDDSSAAWEHETRQVKRKLEMQPSSSRSLTRPRGEAVLSQTDEKNLCGRCPSNQRSTQNKNHVQFS